MIPPEFWKATRNKITFAWEWRSALISGSDCQHATGKRCRQCPGDSDETCGWANGEVLRHVSLGRLVDIWQAVGQLTVQATVCVWGMHAHHTLTHGDIQWHGNLVEKLIKDGWIVVDINHTHIDSNQLWPWTVGSRVVSVDPHSDKWAFLRIQLAARQGAIWWRCNTT